MNNRKYDYHSLSILNEDSSKDHFCNRMVICLFAISLLWLTSLQVCVLVSNGSVTIPPFDDVKRTCNNAYNNLVRESDSYVDCIDRQLDTCSDHLIFKHEKEEERLRNKNIFYAGIVKDFAMSKRNCSNAVSQSVAEILEWQYRNNDENTTIFDYGNCSESDKKLIENMFGSKNSKSGSSNQENIFSVATSYAFNTNELFKNLSDYSTKLSNYNNDYIKNKTDAIQTDVMKSVNYSRDVYIPLYNGSYLGVFNILDEIFACLSLSNESDEFSVQCSYKLGGAQTLYKNMRLIMNNRLASISEVIEAIKEEMENYQSRVKVALANADSFYESIKGVHGIMNWIIDQTGGLFGSVSALCGHSTPNWCKFSKFDWFVYPPHEHDIPTLIKIPFGNDIANQVDGILSTVKSKVEDMSQQLNENVDKMFVDIIGSVEEVNFGLSDYQPPVFVSNDNTLQSALEMQTNYSSMFLKEIMNLTNFDNGGTNYSREIIPKKANRSFVSSTIPSSEALISDFSLNWVEFPSYNVDVSAILRKFTSLEIILFFFDYIYRILETCKIVSRFWGRSIVKLPKLDIRPRQKSIFFNIPHLAFVYMEYGLMAILFAVLQLLFFVYIGIIVSIFLYGLFLPEYKAYSDACVNGRVDNTFASESLYSLAFNYAATEGNNKVQRGLTDYNTQSSKYCSAGITRTSNSELQVLYELFETNESFKVS